MERLSGARRLLTRDDIEGCEKGRQKNEGGCSASRYHERCSKVSLLFAAIGPGREGVGLVALAGR